jgi:stage III sporulation protein AC
MEINLILKVAGIGLMVSATALILYKSGRDEQGTMVVIAGFIAVFLLIIGEMDDLLDIIKDVFEI